MDQTEPILEEGKALVRAIEALQTIEPAGPDRERHHLASPEGVSAPAWVPEEILSASERIGDGRAVLWMSDN